MLELSPLTLTLPSCLEFLPVVRGFVEAVCQAGRLDFSARNAIVLAVNEAASNVIRHAHQSRQEAAFHVQCRLIEDGIEVLLLDEGAPFDVAQVPHLDPSELRVGGRGVFLMRAVLDELTCFRRECGGNALRMVKRSSCSAPPASATSA
jgi:anti-sigma regulatory factor (Ser/Thr protein kinase)